MKKIALKARSLLGLVLVSWKSWGEIIAFDIHKTNDVIQVEISSRSVVHTTLVDYGKNLENVEKIVSFLKEHAN